MAATHSPLNNGQQGVILFDAEKRRYYNFDAFATAVWNLIQQPMTLNEIADALAQRFGMDHEAAERDLEQLLDTMASEGLIEIEAS